MGNGSPQSNFRPSQDSCVDTPLSRTNEPTQRTYQDGQGSMTGYPRIGKRRSPASRSSVVCIVVVSSR